MNTRRHAKAILWPAHPPTEALCSSSARLQLSVDVLLTGETNEHILSRTEREEARARSGLTGRRAEAVDELQYIYIYIERERERERDPPPCSQGFPAAHTGQSRPPGTDLK
ncbi:hypothetical protein L7F22_004860 [Adiantum nelumboides]|nr:hypothetical protein [Adiantum nelumboides]